MGKEIGMMKELKMVVFDMDGVILDSEPLHEHAKIRILKEHGITEKIDLSFSVGQPNKMLWNMMINRYHINKSEEALEKLQYKYILEEIKDRQITTSIGLMEMLQYLKNNEIKIGLASSSDRFYVDAILKYYNISDYFDYIVAGDEVKRKKPEPDIYLKVMELSQLQAHEIYAVEDSYAGSKAAMAAGLKCIGYYNPTSGDQDLSNCCLKIYEMRQVVDIVCSKERI